MSDALRYKLRAYQDTRNFSMLLAQIDGVTFDHFVEPPDLPLSIERYETMNDINPTSMAILPEQSARADLQQQFMLLLEQGCITDRCYLNVSDYRATPWAAIRVVQDPIWVMHVWMRLRLHNFHLLNPECTFLITTREREYDFTFALRDLRQSMGCRE